MAKKREVNTRELIDISTVGESVLYFIDRENLPKIHLIYPTEKLTDDHQKRRKLFAIISRVYALVGVNFKI